jgi:uncharacterized protein YaaW (UPF0174 family)
MSLTETIAKELIQSMSREDRQHFVDILLSDFLAIMTPLEKKQMMQRVLPQIIDETMKDMTAPEKEEMVNEVIALMRAKEAGPEAGHSQSHPKNLK